MDVPAGQCAISFAAQRADALREHMRELRQHALAFQQLQEATPTEHNAVTCLVPACAHKSVLSELHDGQTSMMLPVRVLPDVGQHVAGRAKVLRAVALSAQHCAELLSTCTVCSSLETGSAAGLAGGGEQRAAPKAMDESAHEPLSPTSQAAPTVQPSHGSPDTQRKVDQLLAALRAEQCGELPPAAPSQLLSWEDHHGNNNSGEYGSRPSSGRAGGAEQMQRLRQQLSLAEREKKMLEKLRAVNAASGRSCAKATADGSNGSSREPSSRPLPTMPRRPLSSHDQGDARMAAPCQQPASDRENMGQRPHQPSSNRRSSFNAAFFNSRAAAQTSACRKTYVNISALLSAQAPALAVVSKPEPEVAWMQSGVLAEEPRAVATAAETQQKQHPEADEQHTPPHSPATEGSHQLSAGRSKVAAAVGQLSPFRRLQSPPITPAPGADSSLAAGLGLNLQTPVLDCSAQQQAGSDSSPPHAADHPATMAIARHEGPSLVAFSSSRKRISPEEGQLSPPAAKKISPETSRRLMRLTAHPMQQRRHQPPVVLPPRPLSHHSSRGAQWQLFALGQASNVVPLNRSPVKRSSTAIAAALPSGRPPRPSSQSSSPAQSHMQPSSAAVAPSQRSNAVPCNRSSGIQSAAANPQPINQQPIPAVSPRLSAEAREGLQLPPMCTSSFEQELEGESTWLAVAPNQPGAATHKEAATGSAPHLACRAAVQLATLGEVQRVRDHPLGRSLLEAVQSLAELSVSDLTAALGRGLLVRKAWSGGGGGSVRRLQVLPDVPGSTGAAKVVYHSGIFRRTRCFSIKRVVASAGVWRTGSYLLLDTPRGMLRLQPHGAEEYGRWLLALNALLQGRDDSVMPALELPWSDVMLLTL